MDTPGEADLFVGLFAGFVLLFFAFVLTTIIAGIVRSRRVLKDAGLDPLAAEAQLAVALSRGPLMAPAVPLEQRLTELDDLHRRGVISDAEHATARAKVLAGEQ